MPASSADDQPMFAMSGDGIDDVRIPCVFLYTREKNILMKAISNNPDLEVKENKRLFLILFLNTLFYQMSLNSFFEKV